MTAMALIWELENLLCQVCQASIQMFSPLLMERYARSRLRWAVSLLCTESLRLSKLSSVVNAALTISAILSYPDFDLTKTYFLISGVAGINPSSGTLGAVTIPRYVIQIDLQYELDARQVNGTIS